MKPRALSNPPNPWATTEVEYLEEIPQTKVRVYDDATRTIIARNDSPDIGFEFSVNPYRGCNHGCAYCYARPGHEYLSFGAGTDFDTQIVVKREAPKLLRQAFDKPSWKGALVVFSGVTDCYQPLEASLRLTRGCLEVCAEYQNPVGIITKGPLIERDLDVLQTLATKASLGVGISIPIWDKALSRAIEPGVATPQRRLATIERLSKAGIAVTVMVAPIIPAVSDEHLADVLEAARDAGARSAGYVLLRLPGSVKKVFEERLREQLPDRADKVLHRIRETRGGALYDSRFGVRGRGEGHYAQAIAATFAALVKKLGFEQGPRHARPMTFTRPDRPSRQLSLW
jgi:DNA repair photolyase